tara:strand:+ start:98067 stop:100043 length:1977 start_codon:yes stop_codon:yes gene_type:complete
MKYLIIILFTLLILSFGCQKKSKEYEKKDNSLKDSISFLLESSKNASFKKAKPLLKSAITLSKELNNDSLYFKSINRLAVLEFKNKEYTQFKNQSNHLLKTAFEKKDTLYLAKSCFNLGIYYGRVSEIDTAYYYYNESKRYYFAINDSLKVGSCLLNMSILQIGVGDYYGSENTIREALSFLENHEYSNTTRSLYNNFGITSYELEQFKESLYWYEKALDLTKIDHAKAVILNNIGIIHRDMKNFKKASGYFKEGLKLDLKNEEPIKAMLIDNLGYVNFLEGQPNALPIMEKAFEIRKQIKSYRGQVVSSLHLGEYYIHKKDTTTGFNFLTTALVQAKEIKDSKNVLKILENLSKNSSNRKYGFQEKIMKDSIHRAERKYKHIFAKIRYRTEQKENEYDFLETQFIKQTSTLKEQQRKKIQYAILFGISFLLLIIGFYFFRQRKKIHEQQLLIEKLKARAEEKQAISIHLHDAIAGDILLGLQQSQKLKSSLQTQEFNMLISIFERAYEKARKISQDLSQIYFQKISFPQKIINMCVEYSYHNDFNVKQQNIEVIPWNQLHQEIKKAVYGILQEALTNVLKHAKASEVIFIFDKKGKTIIITIIDNGIGIDLNTGNEGIGILNMQKRVSDLKGTIEFKNNQPKGTLIRVKIPMLYKDA